MSDEAKGSLINIKDVAGLSEPITKLISTIEAGCGRLANALWLNKKDADNEAYRIQQVGQAETQLLIERAKAIAGLAEGGQYVDKMEILLDNVQAQLVNHSPQTAALFERYSERAAYQNAMHQQNIEAVVEKAAEVLAHEVAVSDEPVSQAFVNKYFRAIEDVSEPAIQALWGRILAGEVQQPGSFSLRTLAFLTTLTHEEAKDFERLCAHVWQFPGGKRMPIIFYKHDPSTMDPGYARQFRFETLAHLADIGLIDFKPQTGPYALAGFSVNAPATRIAYNGSMVTVSSLPRRKLFKIASGNVLLTKIGAELAPICKPAYDSQIMDDVVQEWMSKGYAISSAVLPTQSE